MVAVKKRGDVREASIEEARAIIQDSGIEALSLREVSRRLGVSHQAPYKHYPSRDHLLAEVIARSFSDFAQHLDGAHQVGHAPDALDAMGRAYLAYALKNPLNYHLMFGAQMPDPGAHPEMLARAQHAFDLLRQMIARLPPRANGVRNVETDALFVWSTVHGLASILQTRAIETLSLSDESVESLITTTLDGIGRALGLAQD
jgi:AcrR family transcriptional regulator